MSEDHTYKDGDIVWVKLGNNWWPGEVTDVHRQPEGLVKNLKKKPYCVVKFFQEDAYEYIKSPKQIFPFQCSKKEEFIKKGTALYNTKNKFMEKFPSDVETAERLTRKTVPTTDLIIINDRPDSIVKAILGPTYTRRSNDYYDNNSCNTDYNNKRRSGDSVTKILNITPQRTTLETTIRTPDAAKTLPSPIITPNNSANATTPDTNFYRCNLCNFSSQRQNVMILHRRTHNTAAGGGASVAGAGASAGAFGAGAGGFAAISAALKPTAATITTATAPKPTTNAMAITATPTTTAPAPTTKRASNKSAAILIDNNNTARVTKLDNNNATYLNSRSSKSGLRSGGVATRAAEAGTATVSTLHHKLRSSLRIDADVGEITLPDRVPVAATMKDGLHMSIDDDTTDISAASPISDTANMRASSPRKHNLESAEDAAGSTTQAKSTAEEIRQRLLADWSDGEKDEEMTDGFSDVGRTANKTQAEAVRRLSTAQARTAFKQQDNMAYDTSTPIAAAISNNGPHTSKQNRIRNIPKKDRRDAVLKEFISDYVPTIPAAGTHMDNSVGCNSSSSSADSVVVVAVPPNTGQIIILDDSLNEADPTVAGALDANGESEETKPVITGEAADVVIKTDLLDNHKIEVDIEAELQRAMQLEDGIETKLEPDVITYTPKLKMTRSRRNDMKSNFVNTCLLESAGDQNDSNVENKPHLLPADEEIKTEDISEQTQTKGRHKRQQRSSRRQRNAKEQVKNALLEPLTTKVESVPSVVEPLEALPPMLPLSPERIKEEEGPQTSTAIVAPQQRRLLTDCFDFQEDDSCSDTLKSIADFKKKYLSPDKVQERTAQTNNGIPPQQEPERERHRSTEQKDQQLAQDIEMLLAQTADTIPAVVARTHSYGGSSKEDLPVKGLPIKERGKRIFKSRNRARITTDDATSTNAIFNTGSSENVAAVAPTMEVMGFVGPEVEDSAAAHVQREEQQQAAFVESAYVKNATESVEQQLLQAVEGKETQRVTAGGNDEVDREVEKESERNVELHVPTACSEESLSKVKTVNNGLLATPSAMNLAPSQGNDEQIVKESVEINGAALDLPQTQLCVEESDENNLERTPQILEVEEQSKENEFESTMQVDESIEDENRSLTLTHHENELSAKEEHSEQVYNRRESNNIVGNAEDIEKETEDIEKEAEDIQKESEHFERTDEIGRELAEMERTPEHRGREPEDIDREPEDIEIVPEDTEREEKDAETELVSQQESEKEFNEQVELSGRVDIEREPEDIEREPENIEQEPEDVEQEPHVVEKEPEDVEQEPHAVEEEPVDVEQEPQVVEHEPEDVEQEPEDVEQEPDDIEQEPQVAEQESEEVEQEPPVVEQEPHVVEQEPEDVEQQLHAVEEEPEDVEQEPQVVEQQPQVVEQQPEDVEQEPEDVEQEPEDIEQEPQVVEQEPEDVEQEPPVVEQEPEDVERKQENIEREPEDIERAPGDMERDPEGIERDQEDIEKDPEGIERYPEDIERYPDYIEREPKDIEREPEHIDREKEHIERNQNNIEREQEDIQRDPDDSERVLENQQGSGEEIASMQAHEEYNMVTEKELHEEREEEEAVDSEIEKINAVPNQVHRPFLDTENDTEAAIHDAPTALPSELEHELKESLGATDDALPVHATLNNEDMADEQHELPASRITSPTDDNSSVCISEAGAEFGSPTSMLDDERLPAITGRLMTPTEGFMETIAADGGEEQGKVTIAAQLTEGLDEQEEHTNGEQNYVPHLLEEKSTTEVTDGDFAEEKVTAEPIEGDGENANEIYDEHPAVDGNEEHAENAKEAQNYATHSLVEEEERMEVAEGEDAAEQPVEAENENEENYAPTNDDQTTEFVGGEGTQENTAEELVQGGDEQDKEAVPVEPWESVDKIEREKFAEETVEGEVEIEKDIIPELPPEGVENNDEYIENAGAMQKSTEESCVFEEAEQISGMKDEEAVTSEAVTSEAAAIGDERFGEIPEQNKENFQHEGFKVPEVETEKQLSCETQDLEKSITESEQVGGAESDVEEAAARNQTQELGEGTEIRNQAEFIAEDAVIREQTEETLMSNQGGIRDKGTEERSHAREYNEESEMRNHAERFSDGAEEQNQAEIVSGEAKIRSEDESRETGMQIQDERPSDEAEIQSQTKIFSGETETRNQEERFSAETETQKQAEMFREDEAEVLNERTPEENIEPRLAENETIQSEIEGESENNFVEEQEQIAAEEQRQLNNGDDTETVEAACSETENTQLLSNDVEKSCSTEELNSTPIEHTEPEDAVSDDDYIESPPHEPLSGHEGDAGTTITRTQRRRKVAERNKANVTPNYENIPNTEVTGAASETLCDAGEVKKEGRWRRTTRQTKEKSPELDLNQSHKEAAKQESEEQQSKPPQRTPAPRLNPRKSTKPKKSTEKLNEVEVNTAYVLSTEQLVAGDINVVELPTSQALHESAETTRDVATPTEHLIGTPPQHPEQAAGAIIEEPTTAPPATPVRTGSSRKRRGAIKITPRRNAAAIQMTIDSRKSEYTVEHDESEHRAKSRRIEASPVEDVCAIETASPVYDVTMNTTTELAHSIPPQDQSSSSGSYTETMAQDESSELQLQPDTDASVQPQLQLQTETENTFVVENEQIGVEQVYAQSEQEQQQIEIAPNNDDAPTENPTDTPHIEDKAVEEETVNTESPHSFNPNDESNADDLVAYSPDENQQSIEGIVQQQELLVDDAANIVEATADDDESNLNNTTQGVGVTLYPQLDTSHEPQAQRDNQAINVSPMEKVRINVDVANPLSTQIANILGTKSGAASTNAKRKSNLEEDIPSFRIERSGQGQPQPQQQHTSSTLDFTGEQTAVAHVQQMCPNVEITRKEKLIEAPTDANAGQQQESIVANTNTAMFDINNMPIVLGNEHFMAAQGDMQIVLTSSTETEPLVRTDGQQILQQQIFQNPYRSPQQQQQQQPQNIQQRQRKRSTNQQPQQLTLQQQQQPGLIIIKAAPGDLIIQQAQQHTQAVASGAAQHLAQTAADANAKYNLGSGVTLLPIAEPTQKQQERLQQQQQQQLAAAKKPKSPAAAATGGRKQIGNTITLPSSITVKQRQRKLSDGLASAPTTAHPSTPPIPSEQQPSTSKSAMADSSKAQKRANATSARRNQIQQRRLTATYTNLMELQQQEQRRSEARAQLQRRLSYSEVYNPPPAKIFRNTFMAGSIFDAHNQQIFAATAEQQLLQLAQQQQQQQIVQAPTSKASTSTQPPPLHPLPKRKKLRRLSAKPEIPPPSVQNEIQVQQQQQQLQQQQQILQQPQLQTAQFVLLNQPQHLTILDPQQLHQEQQVTEVHMPTQLVAPPSAADIIPAEYEAIELPEQAPQVYTEEILAEAFEANELPPSSVMAVPSQPVPGYPDTLLLCRRVDDEWLPVVAQPYYFTHSDQQLRPIPKEVLIGLPILTPNADKTIETPANDSYKGETGVTILIGNEYVHMEWDQFLEVMRSNDDLFDLRDDQGRIFQLTRDALLTLQNDADLQEKYRQLQQLLEEQQLEEQQQLEQQQLLQQHLMQQLQTVTVSAADGMETDVIPFLQIDTTQTLQLIGTEDGSLILQPTMAQPPLSPPCTRPALTNATNALLNQTPIMSPLETPSTAAATAAATLITDSTGQHLDLTTAAAPEQLAAAGFIAADVTNALTATRPTLGDSLAVIGVVPTQPTLLPTTVTNPAIAPPKTDLIPDMTTAAQMHAQYRHAQRAIYNDPGS